jgi:hypothetical protein
MNCIVYKNHYLKIIIIVIISLLIGLVFAKPKPLEIKKEIYSTQGQTVWEANLIKKNDLLNPMTEYAPHTHEAKLVFRLTVPVIMKIFNLYPLHIFYLQFVLAFFIYYFWVVIVFKIIKNYKTTLLLTIAMACTYFGRSYYIDCWGGLDTYSYFFILLCIWGRNKPYILIPGALALFFLDERGILSFFIIWLGIKILDNDSESLSFKKIISLKDSSKYLYTVFLIGTGMRLYLMYSIRIPSLSDSITFDYFIGQWKYLQAGLFSGIVSFWGLFFLCLFVLLKNKNYLSFLGIFLGIILFSLTAGMVSDMTRSIAYLLPLSLICLKLLDKYNIEIKNIAIVIMIINILSPCNVFIGDLNLYYYPLPWDGFFKLM